MFKKKRKSIFHMESSDETLLLYRPYLDIFILPPRKTFTGGYERKICYTVGRTFDPFKAKRFFSQCGRCGEDIDIRINDRCPKCGEDFSMKKQIAEQWAKELKLKPEDVIQATMDGSLKNLMIKIWKKATEKLGIPLFTLPVKRSAAYQIYEMIKTRDVSEAFQVWMGTTIALGTALKIFSPDEFKKYREKINGIIDKLLLTGFNKPDEWKE